MSDQQWYLEVNGKKVGPFSLEHIQGLFADGEVRGYHQVTSDHLEGQWITVQEVVDSLKISAPPVPLEETAPPPPTEFVAMPIMPVLPVLEDADEATKYVVTAAVKPTAIPETAQAPTPAAQVQKSSPPPAPKAEAMDPDLEPTKFFNTSFQPPPRPSDTLEKANKLSETIAPIAPTVADPALSMLSSLQHHRERNQSVQSASKTDIDHTAREFNPSTSTNNYHRDENEKDEKKVPLKLWLTAIFAGILLGTLTWAFMKVVRSKGVLPAGSMIAIKNSVPQPSPLTAATPPHFSPPTGTAKAMPAPTFTRHAQVPAMNSIRPGSQPAPQYAPQQEYQQRPQEASQPQPTEPAPGAFPAFPPPQFADPNNPNANNGLNGQAPPPPPSNPEGYNPNGNQPIDPGTVINPDQNQPNLQNPPYPNPNPPAYPPNYQPPQGGPGQDQFQNQAPNPQQ